MTIHEFGTAVFHDAGDNSGDIIVEIPPNVIDALQLQPGDELELEIVDGMLVITPLRNAFRDA